MTISTRIAKGAGAATLSLAFLVAGTIATTPSTFAASPMSAGGKALVTNTGGDNIRVRQSAGTDSKQVAEAHEGETVTVLSGPSKDSNGNIWYKVQAPLGAGWIISDFLQEQGGASTQGTQAASPAKATTGGSVAKLSGTARVANTDGDP
ncbi:MAG: SH3 domain-containing protein, partial [Chloroflexi bacterium]|nr:SH3 domain-containing protein [Chloroflexota bacterium]